VVRAKSRAKKAAARRTPVGLRGREATRQRLRAAAWAVFRRHGLAGTTVRAIAAQAGAAVGGLYTYYPDKDALLEDLALAALADLGREIAARGGDAPVVAVSAGLQAVFGAGQPAAALLPIVFDAARNEGEFGRRVAGRLLGALAPLAADNAGRAPAEVATRALAHACLAFGLALFESSGQLARLETAPDAVVDAFRALVRE
jgi:AcrR family transcriptional regulator